MDQVVDAMNRMRERLLADVEARARAEAEVQWHRDKLELLVAERTSQLEERTRELERKSTALTAERDRTNEALLRLQDTQGQLVRSEKLASLGVLVAGVAHEVNTPIGIALTVSSHLKVQVRQLELDFSANRLSRQALCRFTGEAAEACEHIETSMSRAAALIRSFKQVSVDRTSEGRRTFDLGVFLSEVIAALKLMWKRTPVRIEVSCEPGLELDSFPGALGQVVTNLVQNAVVHGVGEGQEGLVLLTGAIDSEEIIRLSVVDDGAGIPAENRERIFDPFFTTRRGQGGSGLGLHIVHNLVTQKLGGTIEMTTNSPKGSCFTVLLPRSAPTVPPRQGAGRAEC
jgi:signal transduction histidine kinase